MPTYVHREDRSKKGIGNLLPNLLANDIEIECRAGIVERCVKIQKGLGTPFVRVKCEAT